MRTSQLVAALTKLVAVPSVSSDPAHAEDMVRCARLLQRALRTSGLAHVRLLGNPRRPLVYGEWLGAPRRPTVLVYAHYDVVAAKPADFRPRLEPPYLYGRGASDDKGPLLCHLFAIRHRLRSRGSLPVNVRVLFDGEEEIGSPSLAMLARERPRLLRSDAAIISDTRMAGVGRPTLVYGLRGKLDVELVVHGPDRDLHSGQFGGVVPNPANALCAIVGSLVGDDGRVSLPGFNSGVRVAEPIARPALDVNGLVAGHTGAGSKGIVPAKATAKLSFRLAVGQTPELAATLISQHCRQWNRPGLRVAVRTSGGLPPLELDRRGAALKVAAAAAEAAFGRAPRLVRSGGSMMAPALFREYLGLQTVLLGFSLPDDGIHGPAERAHVPTLQKGVLASGLFLDRLARAATVAVAA